MSDNHLSTQALLFLHCASRVTGLSVEELRGRAPNDAGITAESLATRFAELQIFPSFVAERAQRLYGHVLDEFGGDAEAALAAVLQRGAGAPNRGDGDYTIPGMSPPPPVGEHSGLDGLTTEMPGRYRVRREHARGGMGRILIVHDTYLNREIVMKELLVPEAETAPGASWSHATAWAARRFLREARLTSMLDHPGIVPIYEMGRRLNNVPYYTMKFVQGVPLSTAVATAGQLEARLALLSHFVDLCNAIAHAHTRGIIHRDIKPSNVIVGELGETVVVDWGVAKLHVATQAPGARALFQDDALSNRGLDTRPGEVIGTPAYMAPEQARTSEGDIDYSADIYSLGAVLYHILVGQPPYYKERGDVLDLLQERPPAPVLNRNPAVAPELAAICQRAMNRNPVMRYGSAAEVAREVERYREGRPVEAYTYSPIESTRRFVWRQRQLIASIVLTLMAFAGLGVYSYFQLASEREQVIEAWYAAEDALTQESLSRRSAETAEQRARQARQAADEARQSALRNLYAAYINLAAQSLEAGHMAEVRRLLGDMPAEYRDWEWGYLALASDGAYRTLPQHAPDLGPAVDATPLVAWQQNLVRLYSAANKLEVAGLYDGFTRSVLHQGGRLHSGFSPDGRWLITVSDSALEPERCGQVFALPAVQPVATFPAYGHWQWALAVSEGGERLVARDMLEGLQVVSLPGAQQVASVPGIAFETAVIDVTGTVLATIERYAGAQEETLTVVSVFDTATATRRFQHSIPDVRVIAFDHEGQRLLVANGQGTLHVLDAATGDALDVLALHDGPINALACFPTLPVVASGGDDGMVRFTDLTAFEARPALEAGRRVTVLAFGPAGKYLAAGLENGDIALWRQDGPFEPELLRGHAQPVVRLDCRGPDHMLVSASQSSVRVWNMASGGASSQVIADPVHAAYLGDKGCTLRAVDHTGAVYQWDREAGHIKARYSLTARPDSVRVSPKGDRALVSRGAQMALIELATGTVLMSQTVPGLPHAVSAFSGDGSRLALLCSAETERASQLLVFDAATGECVVEKPLYSIDLISPAAIALTPEGDQLLVAAGRYLSLYDLPGVSAVTTFHAAIEPIEGQPLLAICPRGDRFAVGIAQATIAVIDLHSGEQLAAIPAADQQPVALAFHPEGRRLAVLNQSGRVTLWSVPSAYRLLNLTLAGKRSAPTADAGSIVFSEGGESLLVTSSTLGLHCFDALPWTDLALPGDDSIPIEHRLKAAKAMHPVTAPPWGDCQRRLHELELAKLDGALRANAPNTGADFLPGALRRDLDALQARCTHGGRIAAGRLGEMPACSVHGVLRNDAHLLEVAQRLERAEQMADTRALEVLRPAFDAALPDDPLPLLRQYNGTLFGSDRLRNAAFWAAKKAREYAGGPDRDRLVVECALEASRYADAFAVLDEWPDAPLDLRALALALRGSLEDVQRAYEAIAQVLETSEASTAIREAVARLEQAPTQPDNVARHRVQTLLEPDENAWHALPWHDDVDAALAEAQQHDRFVMLEVSAEGAPGNAYRKVFNVIAVRPSEREQLLEHYALCRVDGHASPAITERFAVPHFPSLLILTPEGEVAHVDWPVDSLSDFQWRYFRPLRGYVRQFYLRGPVNPSLLATNTPWTELVPPQQDLAQHGWKPHEQPLLDTTVRFARELAQPNTGVYLAYTTLTVDEPTELMLSWPADRARLRVDGDIIEPAMGEPPRAIVQWGAGTHELLLAHQCRNEAGGTWLQVLAPDGSIAAGVRCALPEMASAANTGTDKKTSPFLSSPVEHDEAGRVTRARVVGEYIEEYWHQKAYEILDIIRPTPYMANGKIKGLRIHSPDALPIGRMLGLQDGDVIVSVNGYRFDGSTPVLELAAILNAPYDCTLLRDGELHRLVIAVD